MLTVPKFDGSLEVVASRVADGLRHLDEQFNVNAPTRMVGPFRVFAANEVLFCRGRTIKAARPTGWRGLVLTQEKPIACIDLFRTGKQRTLTVSVRGKEPADALFTVLQFAENWDKRPEKYQIRFITMPRLFVTALWLYGATSLYIPTRTGPGKRPAPKVYDRNAFLRLVNAQLLATSGRRKRLATLAIAGHESPINDPPGVGN